MLGKRKKTILCLKENIFNSKKNLKKLQEWQNKEKRENFRIVKQQQKIQEQMKSIDSRKIKLMRKMRKHKLGDRFEDLLNEEMSIFEGKVGIQKIKELEQDRLDKIKQEELDQRQKEFQEDEYNRYMLEKNKEKEIEKRRANIKPDLYDIKKIQ